MQNCPICNADLIESHWLIDTNSHLVDCRVCRRYSISAEARDEVEIAAPPIRAGLSCHIRQHWERHQTPFSVKTKNILPSAEPHTTASVGQMLDKLMQLAASRTRVPGVSFPFDHKVDFPLLDAASSSTAWFLIGHARSRSLLDEAASAQSEYTITFDGWQYIERTGLSSQSPARVFVAMSFDDALDPAYLEGIKPAVEQDCGFVCVNLKHEIHNDDITDRMLAEIRRCQILVADFTQQKHGVYFEAGFALALGKEVIWCVRKDEMNKVHFDTNHRAHITWETPAELRTRLAAFIQAKFQEAVNRPQSPPR